ncbi:archaetidylserine decarboxylase [Methylonatrum kenyense]|nr:archaetidylserine decarboxylase [Methylonatrum kenyense]MCK8514863.1 archaetidylserine decarboxylase [Methylonatrum kenyense]
MDWLKSLPLYLLPQHAISRTTHRFTRIENPRIRIPFTNWFIRRFGVAMDEALEPDPGAYTHFNAFFTRALRPGARPLPSDPQTLCCPADGAISAFGRLAGDRVLQAKGHDYSLSALLGGDPARARPFRDGCFMTVYLSPRDYHRVHMPADGRLLETVHVPGRLFSVGRHTVRTIPRLFARNERLVCLFETVFGPMAVVLVGAINVGSIETVWAGEVTPPAASRVTVRSFEREAPRLLRGQEMGRFNMGSTVILILPPGIARLNEGLEVDQQVRVGQAIGYQGME